MRPFLAGRNPSKQKRSHGNPESFEQAISKLDKAENLADASAIIISYAGDKKETEAARQLFDLVKRKFPADE